MTTVLRSGLLLLATIVPSLLLASSGGGHGGAEPHVNWWAFDPHAPAVGWLFVDFLVFITLLVLLARKPLSQFLQGRALGIQRAIEEATRAKEAAEARAAELERRLKDLDLEVKGLREDIQQAGQRERQRLEQEAKEAAERLARDTDLQIQSELAQARAVLKAEAVTLATQLAEQRLRETLNAEDYKRLNREFVDSFAKAPQSGASQP